MAELLMDLKDKMVGQAQAGKEIAQQKTQELRERKGQTKEQAPAFEGSTVTDSSATTAGSSSSSGGSSLMEKAQAMKDVVTDKLKSKKEADTGESAQGESATESAQALTEEQKRSKRELASEKTEQAKLKAKDAAARAKEEMVPIKDTAKEKLTPEKEQLKADLDEEKQRAKAAADARLAAAQETARVKAEAVQRSLTETATAHKGRAEEVAGGFAADEGSVAQRLAETAKSLLGGAHQTLVEASRTNVDYPADNGIQDGSAGRELKNTTQATVTAYGTTRQSADEALRIAQERSAQMIDVGKDGTVEVITKTDSAIDPTKDETKAKIESEKEVVHGETSRLTEKTRGIAHRQADVAADTAVAVTAVAHDKTKENVQKAKDRDISGDVASTIESAKSKTNERIEQGRGKTDEAASQAQGAVSGGTTGGSTGTSGFSSSGTPDMMPTSRATEDTGLETMQGQDVNFIKLPPPSDADLAYERMNPGLFGPQGGSSSSYNATTGGSSTSRDLGTLGGTTGTRTGDSVVPVSGVRDETERTADGTPSDLLTGASNLSSGFVEERNTSGQTSGAYTGSNTFDIGSGSSSTVLPRTSGTGGIDTTSTSELNASERPPLEQQRGGMLTGIPSSSFGGSSSSTTGGGSGSFGGTGVSGSGTRDLGSSGTTTTSSTTGRTENEVQAEQTAETAKKGAMSAAAALKMAAQAGVDEYKKSDGASVDTTTAGADALTHGTAAAQALQAGGADNESEVHSKITDAGRALGAAAKGAVADYKGEGDSEGGTAALKQRAKEAGTKAQETADANATPEQKEAAKRTKEIAAQKKQEAEEAARAAKLEAERLQREAKEAADIAREESKHAATGVKDVLTTAHKAKTDDKATEAILTGTDRGAEHMRAATEKLSTVAVALKESLDHAMGKTKDAVVEGANTVDDARHGCGEAGQIAQTAKDTAAAANAKAQQYGGSASGSAQETTEKARSTAHGTADKAQGAVSNVDSDKYGSQANEKKNLAADKTLQAADVARGKVEEFTPQGQEKAHTAIDKTAETAEPRAHDAIDQATSQLHRGVDIAAEQAHKGTGIAQEQTEGMAEAAKHTIDASADHVRNVAAEKEAAAKKQADLAAKTAAVFFGAKKI